MQICPSFRMLSLLNVSFSVLKADMTRSKIVPKRFRVPSAVSFFYSFFKNFSLLVPLFRLSSLSASFFFLFFSFLTFFIIFFFSFLFIRSTMTTFVFNGNRRRSCVAKFYAYQTRCFAESRQFIGSLSIHIPTTPLPQPL